MSQNEETHVEDNKTIEPVVVATLRKIIKERRLTKEFLETEEFKAILSDLRETLHNSTHSDAWSCLSIFGRAASVSKPMEKIFFPIVDERLEAGLPRFEPLQNGEDRRYLAKALQRSSAPEVAELALSEIVRDDVGEKARRIWVDVGLGSLETRENFLERINRNINRYFGSSRDRNDSLVRRIRRINSATNEKLVTSDLPSGPEFSRQLRVLFTGHLSKEGPEERRLRDEVAVELMNSVIDIVRLSFAAASDSNSYLIAQDLKGWWAPASPPREFEAVCRRLIRHGAEALHVFARQGLRNEALRSSLIAIGGNDLFGRIARDIVNRDSSLPEELSAWLCTGEEPTKRQASSAVEALSGERLDIDVSRLLVYVRSAEFDGAEVARIADDVSELMPDEGNSIAKTAGKAKQVSQVVRSMSRRLHINLFLDIGDVVSFDPAQHDAINEGPIGGKVVTVRPGTRKTEPNRSPRILLKPKVKHP